MDHETQRGFAGAAAGEPQALAALLERYLPMLHAYVRVRLGRALEPRESTADVVQSVCRQILSARTVTEFGDEQHFRAWLFTSALNKLREKLRHHSSLRRAPDREAAPLDPAAAALFFETPSQGAIGNETAAAVAESLAALSEPHREVITLARLVGLPHSAIAEVMGRSEAAVRQLVGRAMLAFVAELERRGVELGPRR